MTEIQTKLETLFKRRAEAIEDIDIVQKDLARMKITKEYESEHGAKFFTTLIDWDEDLESKIAEYDKEIEECRKMVGETELDFVSQNEHSGKQRKTKEESYEEAVEELKTGKNKSVKLREYEIELLLKAIEDSDREDE
jgi:nucleoside diphosphate kinase